MMPQATSPQAKQNRRKYSAREVQIPSVKSDIFNRFDTFRIRDISQTTRIRAEQIEAVIREGIRELRASGAVVSFRANRIDGFGRKKPMGGAVLMMPTRREDAA